MLLVVKLSIVFIHPGKLGLLAGPWSAPPLPHSHANRSSPSASARNPQLPLRDSPDGGDDRGLPDGLRPDAWTHARRQALRASLASDLVARARPAADAIAVERLAARELCRGEVFETRKGDYRLGPSLTRELASFAAELEKAVAPHAERLARVLLRGSEHSTPLTRRRHRAAVG
jgi:hypothetical protein